MELGVVGQHAGFVQLLSHSEVAAAAIPTEAMSKPLQARIRPKSQAGNGSSLGCYSLH